MESNPIVPRQRNRRADRQAEAAPAQQPVQTGYQPPVQQAYQPSVQQGVQQVYQMPAQQPVPANYQQPQGQAVQPVYQQPAQQPVQANYQQPIYPRQPRSAEQPYQQPQTGAAIRPTAASYPPLQQRGPQASQPMQTPAPAAVAPRPQATNQRGWAASGTQQGTLSRKEAPHARASQSLTRETARAEKDARRESRQQAKEEARRGDKPAARKKVPGWLSGATTLSFFVLLALVAAYWLMQAYLTTEEARRAAAYQAVLNNYHVTEQADGSLTVTWQDAIEQYAAEYNLQPAFVTAIIRNESSFRTNAESSVGARGLMQLMPDTAEWIAGKLNDRTYTFDRMYDAETNIRYGCWYLGYLSRLFHGDAELVSAAYHAGQSTVTQWLSDRTKSADGVSLDLDRLTDGPTKQYIGRVTQTYGIYQSLLYPDEAFGNEGAVSAGSNPASADR